MRNAPRYRKPVDEHAAWNYTSDIKALRDGWNEVTLYNQALTDLTVVDVELGIMRNAL